ncbi:MAG: translation initiation factor [Bacteroidota bacterium]
MVDHLQSKGYTITNSPNEKLSDEMYALLVKDFASEKVLKQKVEQIKEAKQEKRQHQDESLEHEEDEFVSAEQLRSGYLDVRKDAGHAKAKQEPTAEKVQDASKDSGDARYPGLKVKGKIDLDNIRGKKPQPKADVSKNQAVETVPVAEQPVKAEPDALAPVVFEPVPEVKVPELHQPRPVDEPITAKVSDASAETPEAPRIAHGMEESKPSMVGQDVAEADVVEDQGVVRAADHSPKLAGLSIKGKIDLEALSGKKPKPKIAASTTTSAAAPATTGGDASEDDKKKRRRKRKRKKATVVPGQSGQSVQPSMGVGSRSTKTGAKHTGAGSAADRKKKEDASAKEINDIIKSTLADLRKGAGRSRQRLRKGKRDLDARRRENEAQLRAEEAMILEVTEFITANELANMMDIPVTEIISKCMELGLFVSINQRLEADVIQLLAEEYDYSVRFIDIADKEFDDAESEEESENQEPRAPIITVMGHVDHGKTSLLDYIRKANIVAGEAGGITQHIGAYEVHMEDGRRICFLDTPGHEAFTAMRARGAKVTDLVIIVIAADDQIMPQTREAINHAEAAGVPMVFAINKIDKAGANPEKIRLQLSEMNILVEDWGGKFQCQEISAKSGKGVPELLEKVLLEAEMLELKANADKSARGTVIEARLDKGRGVVATVLVQDGTLLVGDSLVAGVHYGRVRAMMDERGHRVKKVGPSTPVQLVGLAGTPQAGDRFAVYEDERKAKDIAVRRSELYREQQLRQNKRPTLEEIARRKALGDFKELNIIVKGDVDGSVEALSDSLLKLSQGEVAVKVIHKAVGQITEADVLLATASEAIIIGFQVRPAPNARKLADTEGIDIRLYSVIYDAINQVKDALEGLLSPEKKEETTGTAEIREVFKVTKVGNIAGCMVVDGEINRKDPIRLIRDGIVIHQGKLASLKRFKDDVREVKRGFDCGMQIDGYNDIQEKDIIEQFKTTEVARKLM